MKELWEILNHVDLSSQARGLLASLDTADPRFLAVVVTFLVYVGSKMVSGQPKLRGLGLRLAAAAFLLYGGYAYYFAATPPGESLAWLALRSANVAGAVLALTWIVLPVLAFVCSHFRLALAAFLAYTGYAVVTADHVDTDQLPAIALRALAAVALTLVVAWILQPIWDFFKDMLPRRADRDDAARFRRERARTPETPPADAQPDLAADELIGSMFQAEAQRRRDKTRLNMELAYALAMPGIATRLPRATFDDLLQRFLGEHVPLDDIEDNARQLQLILQQHQKPGRAEPECADLEDLGRWFLDEQRHIQGMVLEQHFKQARLAALQQQYMALANKLLHTQPM